MVVSDPVYLEEPLVTTTDFFRQPTDHQNWLFPCDDGEQVLGRAPDDVPNYLFGQNPFVKEYRTKYKLAAAGHLGGAASIQPEIVSTLAAAKDDPALERPARGPQATSKAVPTEPTDGEIHIQSVRGNVYMLVGDGGNIVVQVGGEGVFVVDTGTGRAGGQDDCCYSYAERQADPVRCEYQFSSRSNRWQRGVTQGGG